MHHIAPKDWQQTIDLNLTANWRLIRSLDPLLRQSASGRAIFVTADVGHLPQPFWGAYAVSKAGAGNAGAHVCGGDRADVDSARQPDRSRPRRDGAARRAYPGEKRENLPQPDDVTEHFVRLAEPGCDEQGALVAIG